MSEFHETFRVGVPWSRFYSQLWAGFGIAWNLHRHGTRTLDIRLRRLLISFDVGAGRRKDDMWRTFHVGARIVWFDAARIAS